MSQQSLVEQYPGGCWIGFNGAIDRRSTEQLAALFNGMREGGFARINLLLNSTGGYIDDTHYLIEFMTALPVEFITWNLSTVQSAAVMLYALGAQRIAAPHSTFYFHQTGFEGVAGQRLSETEVTEKLRIIQQGDIRSASVISSRIGASFEDVMEWQKSVRTFDAQGALEVGLVHRISTPAIGPSAFVRQVVLQP